MTKRIWVGAFLFFLSVITTTGFAQNANTSLRGVIKDPSGAVVAGATITLMDPATGQTLNAKSGSGGEYQLQQIPPAKYTITVEAAGFSPQSKIAELLVNQPATVDFKMSVQSNSVVVNVSAEAATLNTTDASLGNSINNVTIQALPSETRNIPDLLSLQPGVFFLPPPQNPSLQDSRSGAVNGGRSDQGNITLDGVDDNDQLNGFAFTGVLRETQDSIEEFRVTTGNANADAGRSSGAQVSLVTKSGTNKFHGAAYEYYRPSFTVANDWFNKAAQLTTGQPNIPGKLIRNIFGGAVGGPILKDKFFFFGNYEGTRQAENTEVSQTTPTASYKQGILTYVGTNPATMNDEVQTVSAAQMALLDAACSVCNTPAYMPGPGANPYALAYFQQLPTANGSTLGDTYNTGSYTFSSPNPRRLNTTIARLDYIPSEKHHIFARGNFQKDTTINTEQFPGQPASSKRVDNTKGMTFGHTWTISSTMVNDVRYGYTRQGYGETGIGQGDYVDFRFLATTTAETRNTTVSNPLNNIVDNFNWTKGKHNIQVGGNWRLVHINRISDSNSFNSASSNPYWLGSSDEPDPSSIGGDPVSNGFGNSYQVAYANLVGTVPSATDVYNYKINTAISATLLADGATVARHFKGNEFEYYIQDSWRPTPKLTLTFGLRHTILQTPYETKGQEVTPTIDTHAWYTQREAAAQQGQVYEPDLTFAPAGPYYGKPGFWPKSKNNIAPRFAVAFSPDSKSSLRAGFGLYFDHYGEGLINTFDQNGAYGLSGAITNPAGQQTFETAPRFTGNRNIPAAISQPPFASPQSYPYTPNNEPQSAFAITWGLDSKLKTPYSESFDVSYQRELPAGFTVETSYVGRLGRHLLQSLDLAEPVDLVDPAGGGDYYSAGAALSKLVDQNGGDPNAVVPTIPYFEHIFPFMAGTSSVGPSATQGIYSNEWAPYRATYGATTSLSDIDFFCYYGCPNNYQSQFWQSQFSSLYALSTIGMSYYNAGQITLHHPSSHGLSADLSYTYSRSIDYGSDAERTSEFSNGVAGANSEIQNTWRPYLNRAVSDFDTKHLLTGDFVYQLPVGRGAAFLGGSNGFVDAFIGGWQLSGIVRATSGLPFSLYEPGYTTDWQIPGFAVTTAKVKMRRYVDTNGNPQFFDNPSALNNGVSTGSPIRLPYPGEAGQRNNFRGDGYFDLDSGLSKVFKLAEFGSLKFAWEVYNTTNTVRFDPNSIGATLTGGNLGVASVLLTQPRRMQFSLRYDF